MNIRPRDPAAESLLHSALACIRHGWHVFPCAEGGKHPALKGSWQEHATTGEEQVRQWWTARRWNIGIACGPSGLIVLDLDVPGHGDAALSGDAAQPAGAESLARLAEEHGHELAPTFAVRTASGGVHRYYTATAETGGIRNSASRLAPLVDVRAAGGYIIAPGSRVNGTPYAVTALDTPAPFPAWIAGLLTDESKINTPCAERPVAPVIRSPDTHAKAALLKESDIVASAQPGRRNDTLFRAALNLGQLVASDRLAVGAVEAALTHAALSAGLDPGEIPRTIRNGLAAGQKHPRHLRSRGSSVSQPRQPRVRSQQPAGRAPRP
jgi:hypothetical protein